MANGATNQAVIAAVAEGPEATARLKASLRILLAGLTRNDHPAAMDTPTRRA